MAREAKIYFHDDLAGFLIETDHGYSFSYDKNYLKKTDPQPISLTLPISNNHPSGINPSKNGNNILL